MGRPVSCLPRWWWSVLFGGQGYGLENCPEWVSVVTCILVNGLTTRVFLRLPEQQGLGDSRGLGRVVSSVYGAVVDERDEGWGRGCSSDSLLLMPDSLASVMSKTWCQI